MNIPVRPLNIASIGALASFAMFLISSALGYNPLGHVSWFSSWIVIAVVVMGVKKHRDGGLAGIITYGQALSIGLLVTIVYGSMVAILIYMYGSFLNDSLVENHILWMRESMSVFFDSFGDAYEDKFEELIEQVTIGSIAFGDFQTKLISGVIISLISATVLKRSEDDYEYE